MVIWVSYPIMHYFRSPWRTQYQKVYLWTGLGYSKPALWECCWYALSFPGVLQVFKYMSDSELLIIKTADQVLSVSELLYILHKPVLHVITEPLGAAKLHPKMCMICRKYTKSKEICLFGILKELVLAMNFIGFSKSLNIAY